MSDNKGVFVLSLDLEFAWGNIDKLESLMRNRAYYKQTRYVITEILKLMEKYNISSTWAVVGNLFLEQHDNQNNLKQIDIIKDTYAGKSEDYLIEDVWSKNSIWYADDVIKQLCDCSVYQEIGSHSFSHIIFGDKKTKRVTVKEEINKCLEAADKKGIRLKSFVFPRNSIAYLEELKDANFISFRNLDPMWYNKYPKILKKICHIIDQLFALPPPLSNPRCIEGLVSIPGSMLYLSRDGFRKFLPMRSRIIKAYKGINKAAKEKKIFHLWFHPFNIATDPNKLLGGLEVIFKKVDMERKKGNIEVKTMNQIANDYRSKF